MSKSYLAVGNSRINTSYIDKVLTWRSGHSQNAPLNPSKVCRTVMWTSPMVQKSPNTAMLHSMMTTPARKILAKLYLWAALGASLTSTGEILFTSSRDLPLSIWCGVREIRATARITAPVSLLIAATIVLQHERKPRCGFRQIHNTRLS